MIELQDQQDHRIAINVIELPDQQDHRIAINVIEFRTCLSKVNGNWISMARSHPEENRQQEL